MSISMNWIVILVFGYICCLHSSSFVLKWQWLMSIIDQVDDENPDVFIRRKSYLREKQEKLSWCAGVSVLIIKTIQITYSNEFRCPLSSIYSSAHRSFCVSFRPQYWCSFWERYLVLFHAWFLFSFFFSRNSFESFAVILFFSFFPSFLRWLHVSVRK